MKYLSFGRQVRGDAALHARVADSAAFDELVAATAESFPDMSLVYNALCRLVLLVGDTEYRPTKEMNQWGNSATMVFTSGNGELYIKAPYALSAQDAKPFIPACNCDIVATTIVLTDDDRRGLCIMEFIRASESDPGLVAWMMTTASCLLDANLVYTDWKLANIAVSDDDVRLLDTDSIFSLDNPPRGFYPSGYLDGLSPIGPLQILPGAQSPAADKAKLVLAMAWGVIATAAAVADPGELDELAPQHDTFTPDVFFKHVNKLGRTNNFALQVYSDFYDVWMAYQDTESWHNESLSAFIESVQHRFEHLSNPPKRNRMGSSFADLAVL